MYPQMLKDKNNNYINQVYNGSEFVPLTEDILDFEETVTLNPRARMLKDASGNYIPQAYDKNLGNFVPLTNQIYKYEVK